MIDVEKEEYVDMNPYENHDDIEGKNNNDFPKKETLFFAPPNNGSSWRPGWDMHTDPMDQKEEKELLNKTNLNPYANI